MCEYFQSKKWISCGINLDEDIHFSTSYLRMSLDKNIGNIFHGYSSFIAIYEDFNEEYFLDKDECLRIAEQLTHEIIDNYSWFEHILENVVKKSDSLYKVFDEHKITETFLKKQCDEELKKLYKSQLDATLALYEYARIPEILDRGVNYFTNYLIDYLKSILNQDNVYEEFLLMTTTNERSIFQKAEDDLEEIIEIIPKELLINATIRSLRLKLPINVREKIRNYLSKWKYLDYHGYGIKKLLTFEDVLSKIVNHKKKQNNQLRMIDLERKKKFIREKEIPLNIQNLYDVYPRLAITKLYRKYFQIRNFYFLDMLLTEIADRMREPEEFIRSMLPEEILNYLETGVVDKNAIKSRINKCIYVCLDSQENIVSEKDKIDFISNKLRKKCEYKNLNQLSGYPVSKGYKMGKCVTINRKEDAIKFQDGDIIISDSADPDIFDIIKNAGAVLTVQGGATSHVALLCREQNIPAIVGVKDLMRIQDGTKLEVNSDTGKINIISDNRKETSYNIGNKAKNLNILKARNFKVPNFAVLNYSDISDEFEHFEKDKILQNLNKCGMELSNGKKYIFRSSAINEDTLEESSVGKFSSVANLKKSELLEGLERFIGENSTKGYAGSIILQEMIPFDFCGVAITGDRRLNSTNFITIEVCIGDQNNVTEGVGEITRIVYDKDRDEIRELSNKCGIALSDLGIRNLVNYFLKIEKIWNRPIDIEWGIYNKTLYILQARPIVVKEKI